jgi:hypothetical protein
MVEGQKRKEVGFKMKRKKKKLIQRPVDAYKKESKVIRISPELAKTIIGLGYHNEPYDNILRRILGMPVNKYQQKVSKEMWTIQEFTFIDEAEARGEAIRLAVKLKRKPGQVIKIRSIV